MSKLQTSDITSLKQQNHAANRGRPLEVPGMPGIKGLQDHYGLREQPFGVNPDPHFLYLSKTHREAFSSMLYRIHMDSGFLAMTAEPGMGKTTLLFHLLHRLRPATKTGFIFQTQCTSQELLRHLLSEFDGDPNLTDPVSISRELKSIMVAEANAGHRCVLIIDEAQNLRPEVLETIRLLSNFETPRRKLLNIVLSGQAELGEMMSRPELQQLRQRLTCMVCLEKFSPGEMVHYMAHRLSVAGYPGRVSELFDLHALARIAHLSQGVPRVINNICFNALSLGYALGQRQIGLEIIREVSNDLNLSPRVLKPVTPHRDSAREIEDALTQIGESSSGAPHASGLVLVPAPETAEKAPAEKIVRSQRHETQPIAEQLSDSPASTSSARAHSPRTGGFPLSSFKRFMVAGFLCGLVLIVTPAIDLPVSQNVSAQASNSSSDEGSILSSQQSPPSRQVMENGPGRKQTASRVPSDPAMWTGDLKRDEAPNSGAEIPADPSLAASIPAPLPPPATHLQRSAPPATTSPVSALVYRREPTGRMRSRTSYVPPKPVWNPAPTYPYLDKVRQTENVQLVLFVTQSGDVSNVGVLSGEMPFTSLAKKAAASWKYTPARSNGKPVKSKVFVTVQFQQP